MGCAGMYIISTGAGFSPWIVSPCTTNVASSWMFSMHAKDSWLLFSALQVNTIEPEHDMPIASSVLCLFGFICFLMVPVSRKYLCPARPWPLAIEAFRLSAYAIACSPLEKHKNLQAAKAVDRSTQEWVELTWGNCERSTSVARHLTEGQIEETTGICLKWIKRLSQKTHGVVQSIHVLPTATRRASRLIHISKTPPTLVQYIDTLAIFIVLCPSSPNIQHRQGVRRFAFERASRDTMQIISNHWWLLRLMTHARWKISPL